MSKLRAFLPLIVLPILTLAVLYMAFISGYLDSLVKDRAVRLAQDSMMGGAPSSWYGVPIWQFPEDLMVYQEIITETKPDVIVETGTFYGGLSIYLATLLEAVNPDGKVLTVDIDGKNSRKSFESLAVQGKDRIKDRIVFFEGSSTAPEVLAGLAKHIKPGSKVMVILDSNHTKEHVTKELELYAPLVTPGQYLIVNDTYLEAYEPAWEQAGAYPAMRDFLAKDKKFVVDKSRNKYFISCAPSGFLKRTE